MTFGLQAICLTKTHPNIDTKKVQKTANSSKRSSICQPKVQNTLSPPPFPAVQRRPKFPSFVQIYFLVIHREN